MYSRNKIMFNRKINVLEIVFNTVLRFPFSRKGTSLPILDYTQGANSI